MRAIVVAGVHSGVGKTTVATGLMAAYARRGLRVQGFKVGPDYIDPSYHTAVTGRPSRTLDSWMLGRDNVVELFARAAERADICVIEGVMGLFDGRTGGRGAGSTAEIAALLNAPVLLVVDAAKIARSAAAIVHGYRTFDPTVRLEGVVLNRLAGEGHYRATGAPIEEETSVPVLGRLGRHEPLALPERYLGLIPVTEGAIAREYFASLEQTVARGLDLERILKLAESAGPLPARSGAGLFPDEPRPVRARIAVARDRAFSFYYEDGLDLLRAWGAETLPFSPLADAALPDGASGVYIGGGFPELFAEQLAANAPIHTALRDAAARGLPIYTECGGYMYAGETLTDAEGRAHDMLGLLPFASRMDKAKMTLGYREARALRDGPLATAGQMIRAHEFHWSVSDAPTADAAAWSVAIDGAAAWRNEGLARGSVWGSYLHVHPGADAALAPRFVAQCSR